MKSALPIDRFQSLLAAYGGRLELFPAAEREAAQALLASSAEARALLSAEAGLDALLGQATPGELSPALARKLAELPVRHPQVRTLWPFRRVWLPAVAWAAAAAFGIAVGSIAPDPDASAEGAAEAAAQSAELEVETAPAASDDEDGAFLEMALGSPGFEEAP
jgi:hypothetical protein